MFKDIFMNKNYFSSTETFNKFLILLIVVLIVLIILTIVAKWKIYETANQKGYSSIIPFYNYIILLKIVELPSWYIILLILPIINIIPFLQVNTRLSRKFGLGIGFGIGLTILPIIFFPILAFDNYNYLPNFEKVGKKDFNSDFLDDYINDQKDIS
ncbi:MAG: signal peptidase I [Bacilli bacterium]|nr:signal peptidase I [Bacilli bacterium]